MGHGNAACTTCRQKSRRCDRARPICKRCIRLGLECGGYPDKFRFCGIASRGKWRNHDAPVSKDSTSTPLADTDSVVKTSPAPSQQFQIHSWKPPSQGNDSSSAATSEATSPSNLSEHAKIITSKEAELLLIHYDRAICPHQIAPSTDWRENPYRSYVIALAYEKLNLLCAVLGFSACHLGHINSDKHLYESVAVDYRAKAINALGITIGEICSGRYTWDDVDSVFSTIQILLLHDICETGISTHGAHISGAVSICTQLELDENLTVNQERTVFLLGNLIWLDIIRAFACPERLCFTQKLRSKILSLSDLRFEAVNGCPREIVLIIAEMLECAKDYTAGRLEHSLFRENIERLIHKLYHWDGSRCFFPEITPADSPLWISVSNAFRHACILRAWRLLDPLEPASQPRIQGSVNEILDSVANVPSTSPLIELLVLPLFMAGADCLSLHSRHYAMLRFEQIQNRSEVGNSAFLILLEKVWKARAEQPRGDMANIPWMSFTHNPDSVHQDDYLII